MRIDNLQPGISVVAQTPRDKFSGKHSVIGQGFKTKEDAREFAQKGQRDNSELTQWAIVVVEEV